MPAASLSTEEARRRGQQGGRKAISAPVAAQSRMRTMEIVKSGRSPVEVMFKNMTYWDDRAEDAAEDMEALITAIRSGTIELDNEVLTRLDKRMASMMEARDKAQGCARDLAPYIHPRLANISVKPDDGETSAVVKRIERTLIDVAATVVTEQVGPEVGRDAGHPDGVGVPPTPEAEPL